MILHFFIFIFVPKNIFDAPWNTIKTQWRNGSPPYKHAHGIIFVYDVTDLESYNNLKQWMHKADRYASENVCKLVVGNKIDLQGKRAIEAKDAEDFADSLGIEFLEVSVKNSINVEKAFTMMAAQIKTRMESIPSFKFQAEQLNKMKSILAHKTMFLAGSNLKVSYACGYYKHGN